MSCEQIKMGGTVRSVNNLEPDEYGNVNAGLLAYPVGAIYLSTVETSPAELFGGTWSRIGTGRTLIDAGTGYTAGSSGGSATQTLTKSQMPAHTHTITIANDSHSHLVSPANLSSQATTGSTQYGTLASPDDYPHKVYAVEASTTMDSHSHTGTISSSGGGGAFSIMQPYLAVYMWKRTA